MDTDLLDDYLFVITPSSVGGHVIAIYRANEFDNAFDFCNARPGCQIRKGKWAGGEIPSRTQMSFVFSASENKAGF